MMQEVVREEKRLKGAVMTHSLSASDLSPSQNVFWLALWVLITNSLVIWDLLSVTGSVSTGQNKWDLSG